MPRMDSVTSSHATARQSQYWYVVYAKPRLENQAQANLSDQRYETWLPTLTIWCRKARTWQRTVVPMFPRYLFLRPQNAEHSIAPVRSTPGVSSLVRFGTEPARISDAVIEELRVIEAQNAIHPGERGTPFVVGEQVQIVEGPFVGLAGVVAFSDMTRVSVLLSLLGRENSIAMPHDAVAKLK